MRGKSRYRTTDYRALAWHQKPNLWGSVNGFVARPQCSYCRAARGAKHRANRSWQAPPTRRHAEGIRRRAGLVRRCTYPGPDTRPDRAAYGRVAQTMLVHHEFDAANVLPLDRLGA